MVSVFSHDSPELSCVMPRRHPECVAVQAVVATIAFGMGIDKSDIRWVVHWSLSGSLEAFSQVTMPDFTLPNRPAAVRYFLQSSYATGMCEVER